MASGIGNILGGGLFAVLLLVALRGAFVFEQAVLPCEVTITPRQSDVLRAAPGEPVRIAGTYRIVRGGCSARFYGITRWVTEQGPMQLPQPVHMGSWDVAHANGDMIAARVHYVPQDALPGTVWEHTVRAEWDRWHMPLGLSQTTVQYRAVEVLVAGQ